MSSAVSAGRHAILGGALVPLMLAACGGAAHHPQAAPQRTPARSSTAVATAKSKPAPKVEDAETQLLRMMSQPATALLTFADGRKRSEGSPRVQVEPVSFRVSDLPLVTVPDPLLQAEAPSSPPDPEDSEIFVDWRGVDPLKAGQSWTTVRVSLKGEPLGRIRIGGNEAATAPNGGGGVYVTCGGGDGPEKRPARVAVTPARWEILTVPPVVSAAPSADPAKSAGRATARYTVVDGWFDARTCKASVVRRTTIEARAVPGGVLYAFRDACGTPPPAAAANSGAAASPSSAASSSKQPSCAGRTAITFLGPRLSHVVAHGVGGEARTTLGSFSRVTLPLRKGGGGSLIERVQLQSLREWYGTQAVPAGGGGDVVLGVEIVQTVDDPEPIAVSYVSSSTP